MNIATFRIRGAQRLATAVLAVLALASCAGGIPSIPDDPDAALAKGDRYFERKRWFQAQEVYKGFLQKYAGHERSDYAQFMLGESYFNEETYALAVVEYRILVTNYGYSEYVDDAFYKEALALYKQSPNTSLDQAVCHEALSKLQQFIQVFNNSPLLPQAQETLNEVKAKLAHKAFDTAMFYFSKKRYRSSMIYFDKIIDEYDSNEYWYRSHYYRGMVLRARGDNEGAMSAFSTVLSSDQTYKETKEARRLLKDLREGGT